MADGDRDRSPGSAGAADATTGADGPTITERARQELRELRRAAAVAAHEPVVREASSAPSMVMSIAGARQSLRFSLSGCDHSWNDDPERNAERVAKLRKAVIVEDRLQPLARHDDPLVRRAAYELGYPRPDSEPAPAVPPSSSDLSYPPPPPEPVEGLDTVSDVIRALDSPRTSAFAFYRLTQLGPEAREAIPHLLRIVETGQSSRAAIDAFASVAADDALLVPELVFLLEGGARQMRRHSHETRDDGERHAARALGNLGARAESALPALRLATLGGTRELREAAAIAVERIESAAARGR